MQKVRLLRCDEGEELPDLTIGKIYEGWIGDARTFTVYEDDAGDENELYKDEYEVVE